MIIGDNRIAVIENIRRALNAQEYNAKVEINDPVLTATQSDAIVYGHIKKRGTLSYKLKAFAARRIANIGTRILNRNTQITGLENLKGVTGGALITSNHFSPLENTNIRKLALNLHKRRLNVISQETNLAMGGIIGFLMNYADVLPISGNHRYMQKEFCDILEALLSKDELVLIYPEQEMWFNYRKPRPFKRGAYYYAAKLGVPVICCFVEMRDTDTFENADFRKVEYTVHILDTLFPDPQKNTRENSIEMCKRDYELKKAAYERIYGKPLSYDFDASDIAGWVTADE